MIQASSHRQLSKPSGDMEFISQPNNWTCNPASFAMCLGISLDQMFEILGHDGSRMKNLKGTDVRDSVECFDPRELMLAAYKLGYAALEFPLRIESVLTDCKYNPHWPKPYELWDLFPHDQRFVVVMVSERDKNQYHCVAYQRDKPYYLDPQKGKVNLPFKMPLFCVIALTRIQYAE